ncbi:hypothetical protein [Achromobacter deleyi]|uniref:hypothetical protein n=1 Tax=Achromobacter deleyi TaxID=1353891 RepID=UPI001E3C53EE|nr:hypothetical protein [Achromobacter deleyi]
MLDHVEIHVSDFEHSRAFYPRALAAMGQVPRKTLATGMGFGVDAPDGYNIEAVCHRAETGS